MPHEVNIFTKFHEDQTKIGDFFKWRSFESVLFFLLRPYSDNVNFEGTNRADSILAILQYLDKKCINFMLCLTTPAGHGDNRKRG